MADKPPKFTFNFNPNIECQVPGEQTLREPPSQTANGNGPLSHEDTVEIREESFVPVLKEETIIMTKPQQAANPVYSLIVDDVISGPHPVRVGDKAETETNKIQDTIVPKESKKPRTRIPTRFRQTVQKLKDARVGKGAGDLEAVDKGPRPQPRRSSIPKLQKKEKRPQDKADTHPKTDKPEEKPNKELDVPKAEEEFEKIFDEIIEDKSIEYMDAIVLPETKIDPELENNFENIIHAYDEGDIEPLPEENKSHNPNSRIPLIKQKSLNEPTVLKSIERTNSLQEKLKVKTIEFDDKVAAEQPIYGKDIKEIMKEKELKEKLSAESPKSTSPSEQTPEILRGTGPSSIKIQENELDENIDFRPEVSEHQKKQTDWFKPIDLNEHPPKKIKEKQYTKRGPRRTSEPKLEKEKSDEPQTREETITDKIPIVSIGNGDSGLNEETNSKIPEVEKAPVEDHKEETFNSEPVAKEFTEDHKTFENTSYEFDEISQESKTEKVETVPILKGNVNRIISQINKVDQKEQEVKKIEKKELPKPKSVLTKIAMFETIEPKHTQKGSIPQLVKPEKKTPKQSPRIEVVRYEEINLIDNHKPRIIEEVLKTPPLRRKSRDNEDGTKEFKPHEIANANAKVQPNVNYTEENQVELAVEKVEQYEKPMTDKCNLHSSSKNLHKELIRKEEDVIVDDKRKKSTDFNTGSSENLEKNHEPSIIENSRDFKKENVIKTTENKAQLDETFARNDKPPREEFELKVDVNKVSNPVPATKINESPGENIVENRLKRLKSSTNSDTKNIERSKSIVEIEIEKSVKGKVLHIIQSMNTVEPVESKKEVISMKERPRKRSVLEKIAMFERKMNPATDDDTPRHMSIKGPRNDANSIFDKAGVSKGKFEELTGDLDADGTSFVIPDMELDNGMKMPVLAVGTALLDPAMIKSVIFTAIDLGYRAFDTAFIYGNERLVGEALKAKIDDGTVTREDLFIMSKLWSTCHRPDLVEKACRASLDAMGLHYFDLLMIHNPMSLKEDGEALPRVAGVLQYSSYEYFDAWAPMEELRNEGLVRALGVANFNSVQINKIHEMAAIKPVINQVECHPYLNQRHLSDFCANYDIRLSCYGTLGSRGTPAAYKSPESACAMDDPVVKEIAKDMGASPAQILIRYQLERGHAVVVKASSGQHLAENLRALSLRLNPQQMDELDALNQQRRNFVFQDLGDTHRNYPFNIPF